MDLISLSLLHSEINQTNGCLSRMRKGIHLGLNSRSKTFQAFLKIKTLKVEHMLIVHNNFVSAILFHRHFYEVKPSPTLTSGSSSTLRWLLIYFFLERSFPWCWPGFRSICLLLLFIQFQGLRLSLCCKFIFQMLFIQVCQLAFIAIFLKNKMLPAGLEEQHYC